MFNQQQQQQTILDEFNNLSSTLLASPSALYSPFNQENYLKPTIPIWNNGDDQQTNSMTIQHTTASNDVVMNKIELIISENFTKIQGQENLNSKDLDNYPDFTQISTIRWIFFIFYLLVMFSAFLGNSMITYIVITNRKMRTVVNYYIVNLAICDILISVFVLPTKVLELLAPSEWMLLNDTICMVMFFLQTVVVFASVLTLVATCFERYFAIVHPLKSRMQQGKKRTCRILASVWILSSIASMPNILTGPKAVINKLKSDYGTINRLSCIPTFQDEFRRAYYTILFVFLYLLPLILIGFTCFCIARVLLRTSVLHRQGSLLRQEVNRRKIAKMILIVVLCFTISWTPYFLVSVITQYYTNFMQKHDFYFTMLSINLFAFLHSSINPIIYLTMSARFQKGFIRILHLICCCQKLPESTGHSSIPEQGTSSPRAGNSQHNHNHNNNNNNNNNNDAIERKIVLT